MTAIFFLLSLPAHAQEQPAPLPELIPEAPVPAGEVQDHALPGGKTDEGYAADVGKKDYEHFDPAPYAAQIRQVEDYLSSFKTLESRFSQTVDAEAVIVQGRLYISRPGRMRLEYLRPDPMQLVVDGKRMMHYDQTLDQATYGIIPDTPFSVLLYEKVEFTGNAKVVDVQEDGAMLSLTIKPVGKDSTLLPTAGSLTLVFDKQPIQLKRIIRTDARGQSISIYLLDTELDKPLDDELFSMKNPEKRKKKN